MGSNVQQEEDSILIRLEATLDVAFAAELKKTLTEALQRGKAVRIELDAVSGLDVTAVQLLWAAQREARLSGTTFDVASGLPECQCALLRVLGFDGFPITAKQM